jgi:hypothetical protein
LPHPKTATAANILQDFTDKLQGIAAPLGLSLTHDQGKAMAYHRKLTEATGVAVYFCDLHKPSGNEAPTRTPTVWFDSTCPKAPTCPATPRNNRMPLPMKSVVGPSGHSV